MRGYSLGGLGLSIFLVLFVSETGGAVLMMLLRKASLMLDFLIGEFPFELEGNKSFLIDFSEDLLDFLNCDLSMCFDFFRNSSNRCYSPGLSMVGLTLII